MNEGRQSPEPEKQTGAQQQDAPGNPGEQGVKKGVNNKETLEKLPSNPEHVLQKAAEEKANKTE
ncbi:hypothetical protein EJ08DRAFT_735164, partial [Tothia fuscella]